MDGTASLIYLLAAKQAQGGVALYNRMMHFDHGAVTRGDTTTKKLAIVFTGDEFAEGGNSILQALDNEKVKASFFFTGRFYRNPRGSGISYNSCMQKDITYGRAFR